jgi:hypothetical protein
METHWTKTKAKQDRIHKTNEDKYRASTKQNKDNRQRQKLIEMKGMKNKTQDKDQARQRMQRQEEKRWKRAETSYTVPENS